MSYNHCLENIRASCTWAQLRALFSHIFRVSLLHFAFFLFIDDQIVPFVGCLWLLWILWTFHGACSLSFVFIAVSAWGSWWWWCCCLSKDAIPRTWYQLRFVRIQLPLCHDPCLFTLSTPLQTVPSNFRTTKKNSQARRTLYLQKCKNGGLNSRLDVIEIDGKYYE